MKLTLFVLAFICCLVQSQFAMGQPSNYRNDRYCLHESSDRWLSTRHKIYIELHESMHRLCDDDPDSCSVVDSDLARLQIEQAVKTAIADFDNTGGAHIRLLFRGWTQRASYKDDTIVLAHYSATSDEVCQSEFKALSNHRRQSIWKGADDQGLIYFCSDNETDGALIWRAWTGSNPFIPIVKHEILHVLGLRHSIDDGCALPEDAWNSTLMRPVGFLSKSLGREDVRFLQDHFGIRSTHAASVTSVDGVSWTSTPSPPPSETEAALGRPAATNSHGVDAELYLTWRSSESNVSVARYTHDGVWTFVHSLSATDAVYSPAIAQSPTGMLALAYQRHFSGRSSSELYLAIRLSTDRGETWSSEVILGRISNGTHGPGLYATYDPATDDFIFMATKRGRIRYFTLRPGDEPSELSPSWSTYDVPSISCAEPAQTDPYNCLVTWQDEQWAGVVQWAQCRLAVQLDDVSGEVSTDGAASRRGEVTLECLPKRQHSYLSVGSAPVSVVGRSRAYQWQIALSQGGGSTYSWQKAGAAAPWATESSVFKPPRSQIPALGVISENGDEQPALVLFWD